MSDGLIVMDDTLLKRTKMNEDTSDACGQLETVILRFRPFKNEHNWKLQSVSEIWHPESREWCKLVTKEAHVWPTHTPWHPPTPGYVRSRWNISKYFLALVLLDTTRNISPCLSSVSGAGHQLSWVKVSPSRPGQGQAWQMEGSVWPNPVHYGTLSVLETIILLTINKKRPYSPNPLKCKHTHADRIRYSVFF